MKYETPQVVELTPAINSIQSEKEGDAFDDGQDASPAHEDWE
jgi:hypothetical protein